MKVKKMKINPKVYLLLLFIIITAVVMSMKDIKKEKGVVFDAAEDKTRPSLAINGKKIWIDIADTPEKRTLGLSGRPSLAQNEGVFFIFDASGRFSFWMKDMNFPIDIIWIDENFRIVDISKNALPESFPSTFQPRLPARYVLETVAGFADKNDVKIGNEVILNF